MDDQRGQCHSKGMGMIIKCWMVAKILNYVLMILLYFFNEIKLNFSSQFL